MTHLVISFSGGETSAFMLGWMLKNKAHEYSGVTVLFANTGQENEETLEFVDKVGRHFGVDIVWLEAAPNPYKGSGTTHRVVTFSTASRNGEPFEEVIQKYGIPNHAYPHCTRELKLQPMTSYLRDAGILSSPHVKAIGIRHDEIDRMQHDAREKNIIYPLISMRPMTKPLINQYWSEMPFRLNLKGYQGNCKWCWKKSLRKQLTIAHETPSAFDFPERMEGLYGLAGHNVDGNKRVFFRGNMSTLEIRRLARQPFSPADDDAREYPEPDLFGYDLDVSGSCSESCEVEF